MDPQSPHFGEIGLLPGIEIGGALASAIEQFGQRRIGQDAVTDHVEGRHLFRSRLRAAVWHHHRRVPIQHGTAILQRRPAVEAALELGVGWRAVGQGQVHVGLSFCGASGLRR